MDITTDIGLLAGALTTLSFLPQVIRIYNRKSATDLSWAWVGTFIAGTALWLYYGVIISSIPVIAANAVTVCLTITIAILKFSYTKKRAK